uniref:Large ribosomal subunit protein bL28c n=1 Tax=Vertebrata lanosa TaxID=1261582 RepID=A0A0B5VQT3_9FLOR|nr:50S ribosomal protein L28 [Vertebrata lanosa]AJH65987.1 50S ribosomal protein L28 [Vertebrata lanosa]
MSKVCQISGKKSNNAYHVSHSHTRTKRMQHVNLHKKRIWSSNNNCWIKIKVSTKGMKSIYKNNL